MLTPTQDNAGAENPILIEVFRGDQVESRHRGSVVVVDTAGDEVFSIGRASMPVYPRSAIKIFQSIPLVESGAAEHFNLSAAEVSLACASHNAEEFHINAIREWLQRLGLGCDDLECGPDLPLSERVAHELIARGEAPTRMHQNCSGKHVGMLTLAKFMNADTHGYSEYQHPTQQAWMHTLSELIDLDIFSLPWERDGCGLPAVCMPLNLLAHAFARYADTDKIGGKRGAAMQHILDSVRAQPHMFAGNERCCTDVIETTKGRVLIKTGAEGIYGGVIPERGLGFALKIDDGATRASNVAVGAVLKKLEALDSASEAELARYFEPTIVNSQARVTGRVLPSSNW